MGNNNTTSQLVAAEVEEEEEVVVVKKLGVESQPENHLPDPVYDEDNGKLEMNDPEDDEKNIGVNDEQTEHHLPSLHHSAHLTTQNTSLFNTQEQAGGVSDKDAAETSTMEEEEEDNDEEEGGVSDEDAAETSTMEEEGNQETDETSGAAALLESEAEDVVNNTHDHDKLLDLSAGTDDDEELFENNIASSPHLIDEEASPFKVIPDNSEETSEKFLGPAAATSDDDGYGDVGKSKSSNCNDIHVLGSISSHGCNDEEEVVPADEKPIMKSSTLFHYNNQEEEEEETEMSNLLTISVCHHHDTIIKIETDHQATSLFGDETTTSIKDHMNKKLQPNIVDIKEEEEEDDVKYYCFIKEDEDQTINHVVFDQSNPSVTLLETETDDQISTILSDVDQTQTAAAAQTDTTDNTNTTSSSQLKPSFLLYDDSQIMQEEEEEEDSQVLFSSSESESQQQQEFLLAVAPSSFLTSSSQQDQKNIITNYVFKPDEEEQEEADAAPKEKGKPILCSWLTSSLFRTCICCSTSSVINQ